MKTINSLLTSLLLTASVFFTQQSNAQAPQRMSYQSVLRNSSNVLLAETLVGIKISVLQGGASGTAVYVETQTATTNANGLLSIQIGAGTVTTGSFATINWASGPFFIKTETDPAGGTNYSITGTQEILSVPYAMYAAKSGDATTMGAIGGSSSTNGATINAGVLSLTPADAANGGIVTNGTQTIGGAKTFADDLKASQNIISGTPVWATDGKIQSWNTNYNGGVLNVIGNNASYTGAAATFWNQGSGPSVAIDYAGSGQKIISFLDQGIEVASVKKNGGINANSLISIEAVGIGTASPNTSAILDASSTTKGMLIPRMTKAQKIAISSPATGLMIFQTNETSGYYYYNGSAWGMVGNMPAGKSISDMLYWNGISWVPISAGTVGQVLTLGSNGPVWQTPASTIYLSTTGASNIQASTATCGGNISTSITPVTARGVCWNNSPNPTIANSFTSDGTGTGTFSSSLTGLMANTTYYIRAYATNQVGTTYGDEISFITISSTLPTLTTTTVTVIKSVTAISGGNISNSGGLPITARGLCWSTSANPTTANSITANGNGIGTFSSILNGLTGNTTYYVRAYATNEVGTAYGNQVSFTTLTTIPPTISTIITGLSSIQASFRSDFSVFSNDTWISYGACWSTSSNPTTSDNHTTDNASLSDLTMPSIITGLTANTTYYVRCYVTTSVGTYYATNQVFFKTAPTEIGQPYLGGKMAYVLQPDDPGFQLLVCKGLIVPPTDQAAGAWGCGTNISGAAGTAIGQGDDNTSAIVAAGCAQAGSAARLCNDLVLGGYSDWFLPSISELKILYKNRVAIGGFNGNRYWSSSDYNFDGQAWYYDFGSISNSFLTVSLKTGVYSVRAVRAF